MAIRHPVEKHGLVATYPDMDSARAAIQALERAGVDGVRISLEGRPADRAEAGVGTRRQESRAIGHVFRRVLAGTAIGLIVGAIVGLVGGFIFFATTGADRAVLIGLIACAFGGAAVGAIYGGIAGVSMTAGWELTFDDASPGRVKVVVRSDDSMDIERARKAIPETGALSVEPERAQMR